MDLKRKSTNIAIVINAKKESTDPREELVQLQAKITKSMDFVATIIHDKDLLENGELKQIHLHVYLELAKKETLKAILDTFTSKYDLLPEQVSLEPTNNNYLLIQYLTHKNDKDKAQYDLKDIVTNNYDLMLDRWSKTYKTEEEIKIEILEQAPQKDYLELVKTYGFNQINSMRGIIKDVKSESESNIKELQRLVNRQKNIIESTFALYDRTLSTLQNGLSKHEQNIINLKQLIEAFEDLKSYYNF